MWSKTYGDDAFTQAATGGSGTGTVSYASSDTNVATVSASGEVTIVAAGSATITATKAADANYNVSSDSYTLTVAPTAPGNLSASVGSGQIALSWDAVAGAESYSVYHATASFGNPADIVNYSSYAGGSLIQNISTTNYTVTGLTNGTPYYFAVTATKNSAESAGSSEVSSTPTLWLQQGNDINGETREDQSGSSVSLSNDGTVVAIGADLNDGNGGNDNGHTRIYEWDGSSWNQRGNDIDGEQVNDKSGVSVSLSGDGTVVAIGAENNSGNGGYNNGHTRIYKWDGSSWNQRGGDIDGEAGNDRSGRSVSLSDDGTIVAIGANLNDGNGGYNDGHTRIYEWDGSSWNQRGNDIDGEQSSDKSGVSVSLSDDGTIVAIGAQFNDGNGTNSGHTRIYKWDGSSWNQRGSDIDGEAAADWSGTSVSLSSDGTVVAIGALLNSGGNGNFSGHTRIYKWDGSSWSQRGDDLDGEAEDDQSGISVSLSSDGTIVAIGADSNDGNGADSGHTRIYKWDGSSWNQLGPDLDGEAAGDKSGTSVSLSSDGTIVAIGAEFNDGNGTDSGHVRVYKSTEP